MSSNNTVQEASATYLTEQSGGTKKAQANNAQTLITQYLDLWSSAITNKQTTGRGSSKKIELYGVKKLRELILELAVRGKLVPQDPNDEPANKLLKRVAFEKSRLVEEKKITKPKKIPPASSEDLSWTLPSGWSCVRFGEVFELEYGKNLPKTKRTGSGEYQVYGSNGVVGSHNSFSIELPCIVVGRKGSAGALNLCAEQGCWVTDVAYSLVPPKDIDIKYCLKLLHTLKLEDLGKGIKPGLNRNEAYVIPIAVPPLAEQHRIVAKVDELMALCDQLENQTEQSLDAHATLADTLMDALTQAQSHTELMDNWARLEQNWDILFPSTIAGLRAIDKLKQTILQLAVMGKLVPQDPNDEPASELLKRIAAEKAQLVKDKKIKKQKPLPAITDEEKPFDLPEGWEWCRTDDFCKGITSGSTPPKTEFSEVEGIPYLKVYNIRDQRIDFEYRPQYVSEAYHASKLAKSRLFPGDVVMNIVGPPLGKVAIIPNTHMEWNCNQAVVFFRPIERRLSDYLYLYICAGTFLDAIELIGTAGQDNISVTKSRAMLIPLPPLETQKRIVAKVEELTTLCDQLKQRLLTAQQTQQHFTNAVVTGALG